MDPTQPEALQMLDELSDTLAAITGSSGKASFDPDDVRGPMARFVVARDAAGIAIGCGAFRPLQEGIAEVKRMYARPGNPGTGSAILAHLEVEAKILGYRAIWLETRLVNERAVRFYESRGYKRIDNFGKYAGSALAVCFEKRLLPD
jgi:GNAT superfamily N-acetyltransferase